MFLIMHSWTADVCNSSSYCRHSGDKKLQKKENQIKHPLHPYTYLYVWQEHAYTYARLFTTQSWPRLKPAYYLSMDASDGWRWSVIKRELSRTDTISAEKRWIHTFLQFGWSVFLLTIFRHKGDVYLEYHHHHRTPKILWMERYIPNMDAFARVSPRRTFTRWIMHEDWFSRWLWFWPAVSGNLSSSCCYQRSSRHDSYQCVRR